MGDHVEQQLQVSQQNNQLTLKNPTGYYLTIAYLGRDEKGVLPGFKKHDGRTVQFGHHQHGQL